MSELTPIHAHTLLSSLQGKLGFDVTVISGMDMTLITTTKLDINLIETYHRPVPATQSQVRVAVPPPLSSPFVLLAPHVLRDDGFA